MYTKSVFIVNRTTATLFGKRLQAGLRAVVHNKVWRRTTPKPNRAAFVLIPRTLNKIAQYERYSAAGVNCPPFTCDPSQVAALGAGKKVLARTVINGTNGEGIVIIEPPYEDIPIAPVYTKYIPKKKEYRVHVFDQNVIDVQEKRKRRGVDHNAIVRNLGNGYVYCRNDIVLPDTARELAIKAVNACGYLYGAVDIVYNEYHDQYYVLETNTKPGIEASTVQSYAKAIATHLNLNIK